MDNRRRFEGGDLEQLLTEVHAEMGDDVTIVEANRLRRGGVAGFFAKERFEVFVTERPEEAEGANAMANAMAGTARTASTASASSTPRPASQRVLAPAGAGAGPAARLAPRAPAPAALATGRPASLLLDDDLGAGLYDDDLGHDGERPSLLDLADSIADDGPPTVSTERSSFQAMLARLAQEQVAADALQSDGADDGEDDLDAEFVPVTPTARVAAAYGASVPTVSSAASVPAHDDTAAGPPLTAGSVATQAQPSAAPLRPTPAATAAEPQVSGPHGGPQANGTAPMGRNGVTGLAGDHRESNGHRGDGSHDADSLAGDGQPSAAELAEHARNLEALSALGLPAELQPRPGHPLELELARAFSRLPEPRPLPREAGSVIAIVGERQAALAAANALVQQAGISPEHVVLASQRDDDLSPSGEPAIARASAAAERRHGWRRRPGPTVVIVDAPVGRASGTWANSMLAALEPELVWATVDATRKPEDIEAWAERLGGIDALSLQALDETESPAAVLRTGIPVARIDGTPASAVRWAALLTDRLNG